MSFLKKRKKKAANRDFSQNLRAMREIAITLTANKKMRVIHDAKAPTCFIELDKSIIHMNLNPFPKWIAEHPLIAEKILDGVLAHECGHELLSKPHTERFNNWVTKIKRNRGFFKLAHEVVKVLEDKRVNHSIELTYRHDFGKRLQLTRLIMKDGIDKGLVTKISQYDAKYGDAPLIIGALIGQGLYDSKCKELYDKMTPKGKKATVKVLEILERIKYRRTSLDLVRGCQEIYDEIIPFLPKGAEHKIYDFIPSRNGGKLQIEISEKLKKALEKQVAEEMKKLEESEKEDALNDLLKGSGAGEGTGEEIPTPEPDFAKYQELVDKNKPEITSLLNRLKQRMKPIVHRASFQKRGRLMPALIPKAYINSFRGTVKDIYLAVKSRFEREQVAIGFLFDYSGSVNRTEAQDITTILTEVFGNYVDDFGYAVACFGNDSQRVKTFFETYNNTKARIGNISVDAGGTEISVLLTAFLKMFNNITEDRRKILVIASDFWFGDESKAKELIELYPRANVELIFIGFCNCHKVDTFAPDLDKKHVKRTKIKEVSELPDRFLDVYLGATK